MSRVLRLAPPGVAPLAALANALADALGDADGEVPVSLVELQRLGAPAPCEVGALMALDSASARMHGSPLRAHTKGRVVWRYERGSPSRFAVRPWPTPQDIHRRPTVPATDAPAGEAILDRAVRRLRIAEAAARRRKAAP